MSNLIIIMAIFVQRQILRLRNNSARQRPNVSLRPISKKSCIGIEQMLEAVGTMRKSYLPRLTDCTTIGQRKSFIAYWLSVFQSLFSIEPRIFSGLIVAKISLLFFLIYSVLFIPLLSLV
ncbi:hypothetical protein OSTOST_10763 [Ostertagia ostertagi]